MADRRDSYTIAQLSDIHCGDTRFDDALIEATINEINALGPDLIVVAGDLTAAGYREQFEEAKQYIDELQCEHVLVIAGNHDCRNVGYLIFEELFGPRHVQEDLDFRVGLPGGEGVQEKIRILALDSNKPDLNDGEVGRNNYIWIDKAFSTSDAYKIFVLHHHLVGIPGTGRERNLVWDDGDVLERLRDVDVDLVLCGHRHVPYVWSVANMHVISSGTGSTWRTRGYTQPSYNIITIDAETVAVTHKMPGSPAAKKMRFNRKPHPVLPEL